MCVYIWRAHEVGACVFIFNGASRSPEGIAIDSGFMCVRVYVFPLLMDVAGA